jgi:dynein heavy chain
LINALGRSKTTSFAINGRLREAETTTLEINTTREGYRVVATRGSVIYFVVANLALVDPMYQYSLQYYKELFNQRLAKTEKKDVLQERLDLLIADITRSIYSNVCRGLFEKDKLLFSFMMAAKICIASGDVSDQEWQVFMVGVSASSDLLESNPLPNHLEAAGVSDRNWLNVIALELPRYFNLTITLTNLFCLIILQMRSLSCVSFIHSIVSLMKALRMT